MTGIWRVEQSFILRKQASQVSPRQSPSLNYANSSRRGTNPMRFRILVSGTNSHGSVDFSGTGKSMSSAQKQAWARRMGTLQQGGG